MVLGLGIDIIEVTKIGRLISKASDRFLNRFFTQKEIAYCNSRKRKSEHFAEIFAGKEAFLKAVGIGWPIGIRLVDIEILDGLCGRPMVLVFGKVKEIVDELNVQKIFITMSHSDEFAIAQVLLVK